MSVILMLGKGLLTLLLGVTVMGGSLFLIYLLGQRVARALELTDIDEDGFIPLGIPLGLLGVVALMVCYLLGDLFIKMWQRLMELPTL